MTGSRMARLRRGRLTGWKWPLVPVAGVVMAAALTAGAAAAWVSSVSLGGSVGVTVSDGLAVSKAVLFEGEAFTAPEQVILGNGEEGIVLTNTGTDTLALTHNLVVSGSLAPRVETSLGWTSNEGCPSQWMASNAPTTSLAPGATTRLCYQARMDADPAAPAPDDTVTFAVTIEGLPQ